MFDLDNDIVQHFHCQDDGECPVTDQLKEDLYNSLSPIEKHHTDFRNQVQATAMDAYWQVLEQTGNVRAAQDAFFDIQKKMYANN